MQSQDVMTQIELSGVLAKKFGKAHQRLISTIHEAGIVLAATIPGFEKFMINRALLMEWSPPISCATVGR